MFQGIDTLLLNVNEERIMGRFVTSKMFLSLTSLLFGGFNLGPSHETLLGLIVLSFTILLFLILISSVIKVFLIPLSISTAYIFYNLFKILTKSYYVENTVELFNNFGIKLTKISCDFKGYIELENYIDEKIIDYIQNLKTIGKFTNTLMDFSNINNLELKQQLLNNHFLSKNEITKYIAEYLNKNIIIIQDLNGEQKVSEIVNKTNESLNIFGGLSTMNTFFIILGCIMAGVVIYYTYSYINAIALHTDEVHKELTKTQDLVTAIDKKLTVVSDALVEGTQEAGKIIDEAGESLSIQSDFILNMTQLTNCTGCISDQVKLITHLLGALANKEIIIETLVNQYLERQTDSGLTLKDLVTTLLRIDNYLDEVAPHLTNLVNNQNK